MSLLRGIAASALGAHLLAHAPDAHGTASAGAARTSVTPPPRPMRIDAGGGAVAYLVESHELPLVDLSISFRSGATLDPVAKIGRTRLFARMLRRGAAGWTSDQIEETIDRYGGELSVDVGPSAITIHVQVIRRNLEPFLALLGDLLLRPTFPEAELARLRREAVAEIIEARDSDKALVSRFFRRAVFGAHPYGRGTTGTVHTIPAITRDDVVAAHALHVRRGGAVVAVAGDLTEADVRKLVLPLVAALPSGASEKDQTPDPTFPKGRRLVFVDKPARTQTQIMIGGLGTRADDPDHVPLVVANTVFGGTFTARLMKEVRSKRGWSYGAYSRLPIERRRESFSMWTFPAATDAAACIALELELFEALLAEGISDQELAFARSYLAESYAFDVDTAYKRVRQAVDEEIYGLPADYHTGYVSKILAVTRSQANAALKTRLSSDDLVVVVVGTASEIKAAVEQAIPRLASTEVIPFDAD
jgi:zinc protease